MANARALLFGALLGSAIGAHAGSPQALLERYAAAAAAEDPGFSGFSAERGKDFYFARHDVPVTGEVSCASCHLQDPRRAVLRHRTKILCRACHVIDETEHPAPKDAKKRVVEAFAPVANPRRFNDFDAVEKWFKMNCGYVLGRNCSAREKGDLITWLLGFEKSENDNVPDVAKEYEWQSSE